VCVIATITIFVIHIAATTTYQPIIIIIISVTASPFITGI
jgi:hypothetical protein